MKLSDYVPRMFAIAAMNRLSRPFVPIDDEQEPATPKAVGLAPDELRKPLLIGRRGKLTRKQRRERRR
jgi:hypothetical protein